MTAIKKAGKNAKGSFLASEAFIPKTDNIMISKAGLKFVDTSWFWQTEGNLIRRGLFIPDWTIARAKRELTALLA